MPRCYAEGPTQEGKDIVLRCVSSEGTSPLQYSWEKTSDSKLLPASAVMGNGRFQTNKKQISSPSHKSSSSCVYDVFFALTTDPVAGTVNVRNASASASGTYRCTASNRVGSEQCILNLKVTPREYPTNFMLVNKPAFSLFHIETCFSDLLFVLEVIDTTIKCPTNVFPPFKKKKKGVDQKCTSQVQNLISGTIRIRTQ